MSIFKKCFRPAAILFLGLTVFNPAAGKALAAEYTTILAELQKDDWQVHFVGDSEKTNLDESFDALLDLVKNRGISYRIRVRGLLLLSKTTNPRRAEILVDMYHNPFFTVGCPSIKTRLITALGNIEKDPTVVDALIEALSDTELQVREAAIRAMERIGNEKTVPFLITSLTDRSFAIRMSAIKALGRIKDTRAVPFLEKIADGDQEDLIRTEASYSLLRIRS